MSEPRAPSNVERLLSHWDGRTPAALPAACAKVRHQASTCRRCLDVCPADAVEVGAAIAIDPDRCLGCGLCVTACPTGALAFRRGRAQWLEEAKASAEASGQVGFACPRSARTKDAGGVVRVPCLGVLDEALLLSSVARGARAVHVVEDPCSECSVGGAVGAAVAATVERSNQLLEALGRQERVRVTSELPALPPGKRSAERATSRRAFLSLAKREVVTTVATVLPPNDPPHGPKQWLDQHGTAGKQLLVVDALRRLTQDRPRLLSGQVPSPLFRPRISDRCSSCGMCATFCPDGALAAVATEDGTVQIILNADRCTGCNLCTDICHEGAITVERSPDLWAGAAGPELLWHGRYQGGDDLVRAWAKGQMLGVNRRWH